MSDNSLSSKYFDFNTQEQKIYSEWENSGINKPENAKDPNAPVFNIALPPPNANGELHIGHSFGYTVMDILGRFHRLLGERVLLQPGKDHAGIQTQVVFEKKLKSEGIDVLTQKREDLFNQCYAFCIDRAQYMRVQEKKLGLSADWSKEIFTLDPRVSEIVYETFVQLWNDGLIYRGSRIVNWSVFSQTSISDVEVEYREQDGNLWYIRYPFAEKQPVSSSELSLPSGEKVKIGEGGLIVATTRPETLLGDTALTVNPEDPRYSAYIGKEVVVPFVNRKIKVVADKRVDFEFGTGVVKVTPAHDFTDYDVGVDHKLEIVQVIGKDGKMNDAAGTDFAGLTIQACRDKIITLLKEDGRLLDTTKIKHKVPIGERGKDIIEPLISEQWFLAVDKPGKSLKKKALELVRSGEIEIFPDRFKILFEQWLENLRDWNISRQLWWGHRIPVWYKTVGDKTETYVGVTAPNGNEWVQETDTFDTWFSSGQWAFSTMAANGFVDLDKPKSDYFPTHTMVMGRDILFFWACRMLLLTAYRTETIPWKNIFFTGLIRDEHGQKMSKSKGNGVEPNKVIEKYGTDSLRLGLVMGAAPGLDLNLSEKKIEGYSKFINKLWNAAKLIEMKCGDKPVSVTTYNTDSAKWILSETSKIHSSITQKLLKYDISIAADELYNYTWQVYCDWYLEIMKIMIDNGTEEEKKEITSATQETFRSILAMLHPFIPYVTEALYQSLPGMKREQFLAIEKWDSLIKMSEYKSNTMTQIMSVVTAVRSVKAALNTAYKRIPISISETLGDEASKLVSELAKVDFVKESDIPENMAIKKPYLGGYIVCHIDQPDGKEIYKKRLEKELTTQKNNLTSLTAKLAGDFAKLANADLVAKEKERFETTQKMVQELQSELGLL